MTEYSRWSNKEVIIFSLEYNPGKLPPGGSLDCGIEFSEGNLGGSGERPKDQIPVIIGWVV